jgi:dTDP-4-amino-4,6-dideoxygalactose transaminase
LTLNIPSIDLSAAYEPIRADVERAVTDALASGQAILGPNVKALEREIAEYVGVAHAVGVASGTDALLLSLRALGVGPGDEVIVPAFTFFATAEVVLMLGATPVLVDVDPVSYNMNVAAFEQAITERTKAVIPVHLFGRPADMTPVLEIAKRRGIAVVEDNAQAAGATHDGRKTGALGEVGCLSFFPTKNLAGFGDGGMILTDDPEIAYQARALRTHGWHEKYLPEVVGYNSRLDELQAAIIRVKLPHLDAWNQDRRRIAHQYNELLAGLDMELPAESDDALHVYHLYNVAVADRDAFRAHLTAAGIGTGIYYPYPLHLVPAMASLGYAAGDFPVSEQAAERCVALPLFPGMTDEQVSAVAEAVVAALGGRSAS